MIRRTSAFVAALLLTSSSFAADTTSDFRKILAAQGFFGTAAGESWPYAGGFLVMNKGGGILTFIDAPDGEPKKGDAKDVNKSFPKVDKNSKTTLSVVLQGLEAIIGGNPGFGVGHSSDLRFAQLDADGTAITYQRADKQVNEKSAGQIDAWIKAGNRVFVVGVALSTKSISVSTDSGTNIDATWNGKAASDCNKNDKDSNVKKDNKPSSNGKPNPGDKTDSSKPNAMTYGVSPMLVSFRENFTNEDSIAQTSGDSSKNGASKSTKPGGDFHFCKTSTNKVTLTATKPLVFALGAYEVVNTNLVALTHLDPVMSVPKHSGPFNEQVIDPGSGTGPAAHEMTEPQVELASSSEPQWRHLSWKDRKLVE